MKKIRKSDNILELVPSIIDTQKFRITEEGQVQIIIKRDKLLDRLVRKFAKTPEYMYIDLDDVGGFIWNLIDGYRTIGDIGIELQEEYGDLVEPLYERLSMYITILRNNKWISLNKK